MRRLSTPMVKPLPPSLTTYIPAEPPSYDSLFGRIRDTHKASRNVVDFVVKVTILLLLIYSKVGPHSYLLSR